MRYFFPREKEKNWHFISSIFFFTIFSRYFIILLIYNKQWTLMAASQASISLFSYTGDSGICWRAWFHPQGSGDEHTYRSRHAALPCGHRSWLRCGCAGRWWKLFLQGWPVWENISIFLGDWDKVIYFLYIGNEEQVAPNLQAVILRMWENFTKEVIIESKRKKLSPMLSWVLGEVVHDSVCLLDCSSAQLFNPGLGKLLFLKRSR